MALLPKGGLQIAGRKVPWEAIAAIAGVAGVILVLRARHGGQNVASVGQAPATAAAAGFGAQGFSPDYSGALANLSAQLTSLSQSINAPSAAPSAPSSPSAPAAPGRQPPSFQDPANQPAIHYGPVTGTVLAPSWGAV